MIKDPPTRKKKAHTKSRKGCKACKLRHIKCDERKPICTYCLTRGDVCVFSKESTIESRSRTQQLQPAPVSPSRRPRSAKDPFDSLPIKMTNRSFELLHHFGLFRDLARTAVPENATNPGVVSAIQDPMLFRNALLIAGMHYSWTSGTSTGMDAALISLRLDSLRDLKSLITNPAAMTSSLVAMTGLAITEAGLGDSKAASAHLLGIAGFINMSANMPEAKRYFDILQRVLLVTGSFLSAAMQTQEQDKQHETAFQFNADVSDIQLLVSEPESSKQLVTAQSEIPLKSAAYNTATSPPSPTPSLFYHRPSFTATPSLPPASPAAWATAAYLFLHTTLEFLWDDHNPVDHHFLAWLLASLQTPAAIGSEQWLWRWVVSAYALIVCDAGEPLDAELLRLRQWWQELAWSKDANPQITNWAVAKKVLEKVAWLQTREGEVVVERLCMDAVRRSST